MAAHVFRHGVNDDVPTVLDRLQERRRRHRVVDDCRHAMRMRHVGDGLQIDDVARRVADALAEDRLRPGVDVLLKVGRAIALGEPDVDSLLRQHVGEQRVRPAIQLRHGDDVVACLGEIQDRVVDGGAARRQHQRTDAPLEPGDTFFEHGLGWVHDPRVDVPRHCQVEQVGTVLGVVELVRNRLVDGYRHGLRGGFRFITAVYGNGFVFQDLFLTCSWYSKWPNQGIPTAMWPSDR